MAYSDSSLVTYTNTNHKHYTSYRAAIKGVVLHHMAGKMTGKACADYFATTTRQVSSNYCIGYDGDIALCVPEMYRAWTTGGYNPDGYYVTIEVSNLEKTNYTVSDATIGATIRLIADIYKRNGIEHCVFTGKKETSNLMAHRWYAATDCPGDFLYKKFAYIAGEVNKLLEAGEEKDDTSASPNDGKVSYLVQSGVFGVKKNADVQASKLKKAGFSAIVKVKDDVNGDGRVDVADAQALLKKVIGASSSSTATGAGTDNAGKAMYFVQCGVFGNKNNAEALVTKIQRAGFGAIVKVRDDVDGDGDVDIMDARALLNKVVNGNG